MTLTRFRRSSRAPFIAMHLVLTMVLPIVLSLLPREAAASDSTVAPPSSPSASAEMRLDGSPSSLGVGQGGNGQAAPVANATVDGLSGALSARVAFASPPARGALQPQLALTFSSQGGIGVGGHGWSLQLPSIERHNLSGAPTFKDPAVRESDSDPIDPSTQDRFTYGGAPLVPICTIGNGCPLAQSKNIAYQETFPAYVANKGWHYYRLEHEDGSRLRFLWSWDHNLWVIEGPDGSTTELGVPMDYGYPAATDKDEEGRIFRWNVARMYDAQRAPSGRPLNPIVFNWTEQNDAPLHYLSDVYDTPKLGAASAAPLDAYAHHVHFSYDAPNAAPAHTFVWRAGHHHALSRVDVTSAQFNDPQRELVRRFWLSYDVARGTPRLASVVTEGKCMTTSNPREGADGLLPSVQNPTCPVAAGITRFSYISNAPSVAPTVHIGAPLPGNGNVPAFLDINADGLPDLLAPASGNVQTVALNSTTKRDEWTTASVAMPSGGSVPVAGATMTPASAWFNAGNFGGDGNVNVLWANNYSTSIHSYDLYSAVGSGSAWTWKLLTSGAFSVPNGDATQPQPPLQKADDNDDLPDPLIPCPQEWHKWRAEDNQHPIYHGGSFDFGSQTKFANVDIDGDGLTDLLTVRPWLYYFCRFGGYFTHPSISVPICFSYIPDHEQIPANPNPFYACKEDMKWTSSFYVQRTEMTPDAVIHPFSAPEQSFEAGFDPNAPTNDLKIGTTEAIFGDSDPNKYPNQFADVNGDGLVDWVRSPPGENARVFIGLGNGKFENESQWPSAGPADAHTPRLHDVDADGLADLVLFNEKTGILDIYINHDGTFGTASPLDHYSVDFAHGAGWSTAAGFAGAIVSFADMDGSGTDDIVIENGGGSVAYVDMFNGARPNLLTDLDNGIGITTHVEYASTVDLAIAAASAEPWKRRVPQTSHVVTALTTRDGLGSAYRSEYTYRDPVYDPRDRAFLGFEHVTAAQIGDANGPTSYVTTSYYLGHCDDVTVPCRGTPDHAQAAYRGLPLVTEVASGIDPNRPQKGALLGTYLSTTHQSYLGLRLYAGMDGRIVRRVYANQSDTWLYDTSPFAAASLPNTLVDVGGDGITQTTSSVTVRSASAQHLRTTTRADGGFGQIDRVIDLGQVDANGNSLDGWIETDSRELPTPGSDWTWRVQNKTVSGAPSATQATGLQRQSTFDYDAAGNLLNAKTHLIGALPLARFHAIAGTQIAQEPWGASTNDTDILLEHIDYDPLSGQPKRIETANHRCSVLSFDPLFGQLPTMQQRMLHGCDSSAGDAITTQTVTWDRGLGIPTAVVDPSGGVTTTTVDGFGRVSTIAKPDPVWGASTTVSTRLSYDDLVGSPIQHVRQSSFDGTAWHDSLAYFDGSGRLLQTVGPADTSLDKHPWIVSGQVQRNAKGQVLASYEPSFWDGDIQLAPLDPRSSIAASAKLDAFGRVTATFARNGVELIFPGRGGHRRSHESAVGEMSDGEEAKSVYGGVQARGGACRARRVEGRQVGRCDREGAGADGNVVARVDETV